MSKEMSDIERMFAEAAGAAEATDEKDPSIYSSEPVATPKREPAPVVQPKAEPVVQPKVEAPVKPDPVVQPKQVVQPQPTRPAPVAQQVKPKRVAKIDGIDVDSIEKILEMRALIDSYNDVEAEFVMSYFNAEGERATAHAIYNALVADQRELSALSKIVTSKSYDAAERAFYLIGLTNDEILAIYEQLELLMGDVSEQQVTQVTDANKLGVCRTLEKVISELDDGLVLFIEKLQDFAKVAVQ